MHTQPDLDKMRTVRQGLESVAKSGGVNSVWLKSNPLFFMAIGDADLYEGSLRETLIDCFKSFQTISNFLESIVLIDQDPHKHAFRFKDLLQNNDNFRRKFYTFFLRFLIVAKNHEWTREHGFNNYNPSGKKRDAVETFMRSVLSVSALDCDEGVQITHSQIAEFVDQLISNRMSFKTYAEENTDANNDVVLNDENVCILNVEGLGYDI